MTRHRTAAPLLVGVLLAAAAACVDVRVSPVRVHIRWAPGVDAAARESAERTFGLVDGREEANRWSYRVMRTAAGPGGLFGDPRVATIEDLRRGDSVPPGPQVAIGWRGPGEIGGVLQPQSAIAAAIAAILAALSMAASRRVRAAGALSAVAVLACAMLLVPLDQPIRMGDYGTYVASRSSFEVYIAGPAIRFEAHLSSALLRLIDRGLGADDRSPALAFADLARYASIWHCLMLALAGWAMGWAPSALRYLAIVTMAPATLMFFGFRELGYLSLNAAVFPLLVVGLCRSASRFNGGCALAGIGAALHGFGVLALAGAAAMSLAAPGRLPARMGHAVRAFAYGVSAYLIWIFLYVTVLKVNVLPGHAGEILWRPLWHDRFEARRVNAALFSFQGGVETAIAFWLSGAVLLAIAAAAVRRYPRETVLAAAFAAPPLIFQLLFWPIQGLAVEGDLLVAAFPGFYGLAWLAARSSAMTAWALAPLAAAQIVFWRVMLGSYFVN